MFIGSFSLHSKWIGLSKRDPKSSVLRRDVESDRLIGNCDESCSSNKITDTISSKIIIFIQAFKMYVSDFVSLRLLPVALLSSVACELAPLRIVLLCVFLYLFFIFLLLF